MSYDEGVPQTLTIAYCGEALQDGTIDVKDLAPSLLALGELFEAANGRLHDDASRVTVRIRATGKGSFQVDLDLAMTLVEQVTAFFNGDTASGLLNLIEYVGLGAAGLTGAIQLLKKLRGRKPDQVIENEDGTVVLIVERERIVVQREVVYLIETTEVRQAVTRFVEPLHRSDVEIIEVRAGGADGRALATKDDLPALEADFAIEDGAAVESTYRAALSLLTVSFQEQNKWRLSDGDRQFWATVEDERFQQQIDEQRAAFGKHDVLICRVRQRQTQTQTGLKSEYAVEEVLEHRPAMRQLQLLPPKNEGN